jgi:HD-like signal output (HDOD) protein
MQARGRNYGKGFHQIDDVGEFGECEIDPGELKQRLLEVFRSPDYTPPLLPTVALELLALTRKPNVKSEQVVQLLGSDPLLAGQVLKVAQSALYSRGSPLHSLEEAVVRLGLERVSELFLRVSVETKVFRAPGYAEPMNQLRRHSAFTAEAARVISRRTSGLESFAFLCGLLHDVGIAACILALSGPLSSLAPKGFERAWPCVQAVHTFASELLAKVWGLPPDVALVLSLHHQPRFDGHIHPLAAAVRYADIQAELHGFGFMNDSETHKLDEAARQLGLTSATQAHLNESLAELAARLAA